MAGRGQNLQVGLVLGRILANLCSVGRIQCSSFHRKEVASDPRPFILERLQVDSQSESGDSSSDLDVMYSLDITVTGFG